MLSASANRDNSTAPTRRVPVSIFASAVRDNPARDAHVSWVSPASRRATPILRPKLAYLSPHMCLYSTIW